MPKYSEHADVLSKTRHTNTSLVGCCDDERMMQSEAKEPAGRGWWHANTVIG